MSDRLSLVVRSAPLAVVALLAASPCAVAAPPQLPTAHLAPGKPADAVQQRPSDGDAASRNVMARSRMLECGHQWNSLKRNGAASGTWKDFSRGCLAQR